MKKETIEIRPDRFSSAGKKEQVEKMFDSIAPRYDFLNNLLSLGIDRGWRKKAIASLRPASPMQILDVATGTGDLAICALELCPEQVTGIDISAQMLEAARSKPAFLKAGGKIILQRGDAENLPFEHNQFDAVTVGFGVRNFGNLEKGLSELHRVLKPGGRLAILEFSKPLIPGLRQLFNVYFHHVLPFIGRLLSGSATAYRYLPESVKHFPEGKAFAEHLKNAGFHGIHTETLTFGICSLYTAAK